MTWWEITEQVEGKTFSLHSWVTVMWREFKWTVPRRNVVWARSGERRSDWHQAGSNPWKASQYSQLYSQIRRGRREEGKKSELQGMARPRSSRTSYSPVAVLQLPFDSKKHCQSTEQTKVRENIKSFVLFCPFPLRLALFTSARLSVSFHALVL